MAGVAPSFLWEAPRLKRALCFTQQSTLITVTKRKWTPLGSYLVTVCNRGNKWRCYSRHRPLRGSGMVGIRLGVWAAVRGVLRHERTAAWSYSSCCCALTLPVDGSTVSYLGQIFQGRYIPDLYDLYDPYDLYELAHVAGWEPHNLHDLGHGYWVGSVLHRSCTTFHNGRWGARRSR